MALETGKVWLLISEIGETGNEEHRLIIVSSNRNVRLCKLSVSSSSAQNTVNHINDPIDGQTDRKPVRIIR